MPTIPTQQACTGHIIPGFTNNLLSLGKLYNANCTAYHHKHHLLVKDKNCNTIFQGTCKQSGACLWHASISPTTQAPPLSSPHRLPQHQRLPNLHLHKTFHHVPTHTHTMGPLQNGQALPMPWPIATAPMWTKLSCLCVGRSSHQN